MNPNQSSNQSTKAHLASNALNVVLHHWIFQHLKIDVANFMNNNNNNNKREVGGRKVIPNVESLFYQLSHEFRDLKGRISSELDNPSVIQCLLSTAPSVLGKDIPINDRPSSQQGWKPNVQYNDVNSLNQCAKDLYRNYWFPAAKFLQEKCCEGYRSVLSMKANDVHNQMLNNLQLRDREQHLGRYLVYQINSFQIYRKGVLDTLENLFFHFNWYVKVIEYVKDTNNLANQDVHTFLAEEAQRHQAGKRPKFISKGRCIRGFEGFITSLRSTLNQHDRLLENMYGLSLKIYVALITLENKLQSTETSINPYDHLCRSLNDAWGVMTYLAPWCGVSVLFSEKESQLPSDELQQYAENLRHRHVVAAVMAKMISSNDDEVVKSGEKMCLDHIAQLLIHKYFLHCRFRHRIYDESKEDGGFDSTYMEKLDYEESYQLLADYTLKGCYRSLAVYRQLQYSDHGNVVSDASTIAIINQHRQDLARYQLYRAEFVEAQLILYRQFGPLSDDELGAAPRDAYRWYNTWDETDNIIQDTMGFKQKLIDREVSNAFVPSNYSMDTCQYPFYLLPAHHQASASIDDTKSPLLIYYHWMEGLRRIHIDDTNKMAKTIQRSLENVLGYLYHRMFAQLSLVLNTPDENPIYFGNPVPGLSYFVLDVMDFNKRAIASIKTGIALAETLSTYPVGSDALLYRVGEIDIHCLLAVAYSCVIQATIQEDMDDSSAHISRVLGNVNKAFNSWKRHDDHEKRFTYWSFDKDKPWLTSAELEDTEGEPAPNDKVNNNHLYKVMIRNWSQQVDRIHLLSSIADIIHSHQTVMMSKKRKTIHFQTGPPPDEEDIMNTGNLYLNVMDYILSDFQRLIRETEQSSNCGDPTPVPPPSLGDLLPPRMRVTLEHDPTKSELPIGFGDYLHMVGEWIERFFDCILLRRATEPSYLLASSCISNHECALQQSLASPINVIVEPIRNKLCKDSLTFFLALARSLERNRRRPVQLLSIEIEKCRDTELVEHFRKFVVDNYEGKERKEDAWVQAIISWRNIIEIFRKK